MSTTPFVWSDVSGSVGISSDYIWRGASQSAGNPSYNLNLEADAKGFYGGVWAGQVDFETETDWEYDLYAGYAMSLSDSISFDVGVIQYRYDVGIDPLEEIYVGVNYGDFGIKYYRDTEDSDNQFVVGSYNVGFVPVVDVSLEYGRIDEDNDYKALNLGYDFDNGVSVGAHVLSSAFRGEALDNISVSLGYNF